MPGQELRLLSLDGGGVRGLSTLFILQALMQRINPDNPPKPCDYFDMIGGTSTGGLIAIMLGRLRMSVRECIEAYTELASKVFVKEHLLPAKKLWKLHRAKLRARFSSEVLKQCICDVLQKSQRSADELLKDTLPMSCKVCVFATSTGTSTPVAIRSYPPAREADDMYQTTKIWEAGRATSAASTFFDAIKIGPHKQEFTDGGTGANNPIQYLWNEAQDLYTPDSRLEDHLACIVSIGTGRPTFKEFGDDLADLADTMVRIATQTEETAELFHQRNRHLAQSGKYFRFNVGDGLGEIGLDEAAKVGQIKDRTDKYLGEEVNFERLSRCAKALEVSEKSDELTYQQCT
ncbi:FabD/lysophospholipase-like protein [Polychaeton citri CBS 116435]|uniref:FabD/lysophospholipase-like protein n=1 Tax=Polychaeton citri CBS 116435 TaxID=1314669 RepID=A0A9P4UVM8_9PEZI|nr:FabD/lysophospholipase-like protein [Polychaeton citri CBS 116435]